MKEPKTYLSQKRIIATKEFIKENGFALKKQDEIVFKIEQVNQESNFFDFRAGVLVEHLCFEKAKQFLQQDYIDKVEKKELEFVFVSEIEEATQDFLDYMNFAWGKAEDERGLSATRSIQKLSAWLWLLGREDLAEKIEDDNLYNPYGAPALIEVCNSLKIKVPKSLLEFSKIKC